MENGENKSQNQKKKFVNPWRQSLPSLPQSPKFRNLKRAILILLVFFVLAVAVPRLYSEISFRWQYRDLIAQQKAYERDYIKYSGKTPQEVYEKYISALKRGDIEEASKYYSAQEDQIKEKQWLEKLKAGGKSDGYINKLPTWSDLKEEGHWNKNNKRFVHEYILERDKIEYDERHKKEFIRPAGVYNDFAIEFFYDSSLKIWKLSSL
jgi:hypothetical protein